ncbi:MAG: hypothetical protein Q8O67_34225 [Deltaproteobacteria bacterium]|nr:hypothetical protein [Deltaproteobacteria bacterium]
MRVVVVVVVVAGCFDPAVPAGAVVSCAVDADCDNALLICDPGTRLCRAASATAPGLIGTPTLAPARLAADDVVTVAFSAAAVAGLPFVRFIGASGAHPFDVDDDGAGGFTATTTVRAADGEGSFAVAAEVVSVDGVAVTLPLGTVTLDLTPPLVIDGTVQAQLTAVGVVDDLTALGPLGSVELSFIVNEPLLGPPIAVLGDVEQPCELVGATFARCRFDGDPGAVDDDAAPVSATLTDLVGNSAVVTVAVVDVDNTAPLAPPVELDGAVVYRRLPWGAGETSGAVAMFVEVGAGVAEALTLIVRAGPGADSAELGRGRVSPGLGSQVALVPGDRPRVFASFVDGAGNASPAVEVREGQWVATLGFKVVGSTLENPHRVVTQALAVDALDLPLGQVFGADEVLLPARVDGGALSFAQVAGPAPVGRLTMIWDASTATVMALTATGEVWHWAGRSWRKDAVIDTADDGEPAARDDAQLGFDVASGLPLLIGGTNAIGLPVDDGVTWQRVGGSWRALALAGPQQRFGGAVVVDTTLRRLVVLGGFDIDIADAPVSWWTWDGAAWTDQGLLVLPQVAGDVVDTRAAHDRATGRTIIVISGPATGRRTFTQVGSSFSAVLVDEPPGAPPRLLASADAVFALAEGLRRFDADDTWAVLDATLPFAAAAAATIDVAREVVVVVDEAGQTWERGLLPGDAWRLLHDGVRPPARRAASLASLPGGAELVLFGGRVGFVDVLANDAQDTWLFDGRRWREVAASPPLPDSRRGHGAATTPEGVLIAGGVNREDTWLFDGDSWTERVSTGARFNEVSLAPAPAAAGGGTLLTNSTASGTLMILRPGSSAWEDVVVVGGPGGSEPRLLAFDPGRDEMVLVGGGPGGGFMNERTWDGVGEVRLRATRDMPDPSRFLTTLTFDEHLAAPLVFGGQAAFSAELLADLWARPSSTGPWEPLDTTLDPERDGGPEPGAQQSLAWLPAARASVIFGGLDAGGTHSNETWLIDGHEGGGPAAHVVVDVSAALLGTAALLSAQVSVVAGGGGQQDGVVVERWDQQRFVPCGSSSTASLAVPAAVSCALDATALERALAAGRRLRLRVRPLAANGPSGASVVVDDVEVRLRYRQ